MKNLVLNFTMNSIEKNYNYDKTKLAEIKYGLETLYLTITKTIVIFGVAYFLGIIKPLLLIMLFYGLLRLTAFGLHAKKSWQCWVSSGIIFLGLPYLCQYAFIPYIAKIIVSILGFILIVIYAPADTEKKPIISKKRRLVYKILASITCFIYLILMFINRDNYFTNVICISILLQTILILPITYKIFNLKYDNYKRYCK